MESCVCVWGILEAPRTHDSGRKTIFDVSFLLYPGVISNNNSTKQEVFS